VEEALARRCGVVVGGCAFWRRPGIHTPDGGYGFRARAEPVIGHAFARPVGALRNDDPNSSPRSVPRSPPVIA
jgi:hypothetical protein